MALYFLPSYINKQPMSSTNNPQEDNPETLLTAVKSTVYTDLGSTVLRRVLAAVDS